MPNALEEPKNVVNDADSKIEEIETLQRLDDEKFCDDCESNGAVQNDSENFLPEIPLHILELMKVYWPEWLHKSFHGDSVDGVSTRLMTIVASLAIIWIGMFTIQLVFDKTSREQPLKAKIAALDKALFKAKNNELIVRRELDEARSRISFKERGESNTEDFTTSTVLDSITTESPSRTHFHQAPTQWIKEIEGLKSDKAKLENEYQDIILQNKEVSGSLESKSQEVSILQAQLDNKIQELKETISKDVRFVNSSACIFRNVRKNKSIICLCLINVMQAQKYIQFENQLDAIKGNPAAAPTLARRACLPPPPRSAAIMPLAPPSSFSSIAAVPLVRASSILTTIRDTASRDRA